MTAPTKVVRVATTPPGGADQATTEAAEATRWGMFGTVVQQQPDPATGDILTDVEVTRRGHQTLTAAVNARRGARLVDLATPVTGGGR